MPRAPSLELYVMWGAISCRTSREIHVAALSVGLKYSPTQWTLIS